MAEIGNSIAVQSTMPARSAGVHMLLAELASNPPTQRSAEELAAALTNWELREAMDVAAGLERQLADIRRWVRARIADRLGKGNQVRLGEHLYRHSKTPTYRAREGGAASILDIIAEDGRLGLWFNVNDALSSNAKVDKLAAAFKGDLGMYTPDGVPATEDGEPCVDTETGEWIEGREHGQYRDARHYLEAMLVETVWPDDATLKEFTKGQRGWPAYADDLPDGEVVPVGKPKATN